MNTIYKISLSLVILLFLSCGNPVKNSDNEVIVEQGTEVSDTNTISRINKQPKPLVIEEAEVIADTSSLIGNYVGYFKPDEDKNESYERVFADEGFYWNRDNKINISIDKIQDSIVIGHSVVAGNDRPFKGTMRNPEKNKFEFIVSEPGDDKYDGEFAFTIAGNQLTGTWEAYGNLEIKYRKYTLDKKEFKYDPEIMLKQSGSYVEWKKYIEYKDTVEIDDGVFEEWVTREFATTTQKIYDINASNTILNKSDVENLKRGDLLIIRNTIYARHGYSFKNRPLRVFFDAQDWYIPVHTDIRSDFTEIEKQNIELLLRYEKNAAEYYDSFGRG
ncbi:YARHG domain-containing protein [Marinigracilibium pacificum]|uniref:YARHG domain-containing protein n=1 Tax=Marinigracilibium pacificum TaxID=2729599 RepID=A0A848J7P4_9BACT|nr:YARHG domain-containing protein [Marinigracilibium pacificum]NMM49122.1 YARHG domain-containing protein [Marinigracilibium pacificum]